MTITYSIPPWAQAIADRFYPFARDESVIVANLRHQLAQAIADGHYGEQAKTRRVIEGIRALTDSLQ